MARTPICDTLSLCRLFLSGHTRGQNHRKTVFIDGDTLYSHGHHYPIARRLEDGSIAIQKQRYARDKHPLGPQTRSTSRHLWRVRQSLYLAGMPYVERDWEADAAVLEKLQA